MMNETMTWMTMTGMSMLTMVMASLLTYAEYSLTAMHHGM